MIKVVKFGGSSLANATQIEKVGDIILEDKNRRYVVPSAPGKRSSKDVKVTDLLYQCWDAALKEDEESSQDGPGWEDLLARVQARYEDILEGLDLSLSLDADFDEIRQHLQRKEGRDFIVSRGEYLCGKILSAYLDFPFIDAADVIFFDEDGQYNADKTYDVLSRRLSETEYAVIPGFYGSLPDGSVHTFTRGGSDITGSVVARAVNADMYENWTDVSGFLIADPHIVPNPKTIDTITYRELRELSYMGATVLHEAAVFPVKNEGIPIHIRNTDRPQDHGTLIVEATCQKPKYTITGIAGKKNFAAVTIEKEMMNSEIGFCRKVLQVFEDNELSIEHMPSGIDTMTVFVQQDVFEEKEQEVISGIHKAVNPDVVELETDLALIAVVGRGMRSLKGTSGRIFSALAHANVNVKMIDQGSSELNIIIGVENKDFEAAIRAIYDIFVTTQL